jgi:hypothetical protein
MIVHRTHNRHEQPPNIANHDQRSSPETSTWRRRRSNALSLAPSVLEAADTQCHAPPMVVSNVGPRRASHPPPWRSPTPVGASHPYRRSHMPRVVPPPRVLPNLSFYDLIRPDLPPDAHEDAAHAMDHAEIAEFPRGYPKGGGTQGELGSSKCS